MSEQMIHPETISPEALQLRDIHLPEAISWWPLAPGWWIVLTLVLLTLVVIFISRKIYKSRQLRREIHTELEQIKIQFQQSSNTTQLARSLSTLLRRANISYFPKANIAGLTGEQWLAHLDNTNNRSADICFQSSTGEILLSAPYLPDDSALDFDAQGLIALCESWLLSAHNKTQVGSS